MFLYVLPKYFKLDFPSYVDFTKATLLHFHGSFNLWVVIFVLVQLFFCVKLELNAFFYSVVGGLLFLFLLTSITSELCSVIWSIVNGLEHSRSISTVCVPRSSL